MADLMLSFGLGLVIVGRLKDVALEARESKAGNTSWLFGFHAKFLRETKNLSSVQRWVLYLETHVSSL